MRKIDQLLSEYGESHQNETNKMIHWICVPLIVFSVIAILWEVQLPFIGHGFFFNLGALLLLVTLLYYLRLSFSLFLGMIVYAAACIGVIYFIVTSTTLQLWLVALTIFVLAWIGQFYGHKVEGKKPSFLKDVQFLLVGPAWLMHFIFKKTGIPY